jgi:hypothetical protein
MRTNIARWPYSTIAGPVCADGLCDQSNSGETRAYVGLTLKADVRESLDISGSNRSPILRGSYLHRT